jgi:hypothetical protein
MDNFTIDFEVLDNRMGDVNGDDLVNVADVVEMVNYVMGVPSAYFVSSVADMNTDGDINLFDLVKVVNVILSEGSQSANMPVRLPVASQALLSTDGRTVSIAGAQEYTALQMDIVLDGGMALRGVETQDGHSAVFSRMDNGAYRVVVYSMSNTPFSSESPQLILDMEGEGTVTLSNGILVTAEGRSVGVEPCEGQVTGITAVEQATALSGTVYTLQGTLVGKQSAGAQLPKGVYIIDGKKVVVK